MARNRDLTRREVLGGLGVAAGALWLGPRVAFGKEGGLPYKVTGWSGTNPEVAHRLRDGWSPSAVSPKERHEVVIVGGGISGLGAAVRMKDMDAIVLESESEFGGNARKSTWRGHEFNIGSAYIVDVDGEFGQFYDEIGLKLTRIPSPVDRWHLGSKWIKGPWEDETIARLPKDLSRAMTDLKKTLVGIVKSPDYPDTPFEKATPKALELDKITFAEWLKPYAHPDLVGLLDAFCVSAIGGTTAVVSAYGGLNLLSEVLLDAYAFPEGNHRIAATAAEVFEKAGAGRIRTGCHVYAVEPKGDDHAVVRYVQDGKPLAVEASRVLLATPYFLSGALLSGANGDMGKKLGSQDYCAYVVANLCFDKVVSRDGYDSWVPGSGGFEDFIPSDWMLSPTARKKGQVISLFAPCRLDCRERLAEATAEDFAAPIVESFLKVVPKGKKVLREVHMTRWGHAFLVNRPGIYTNWLPSLKKRMGPIYLGHGDGQGLPAVEFSLQESLAAAKSLRDEWKKS